MRFRTGRVRNALDQAGPALFVFVALSAVILWSTGSLHFGPADDGAPAAAPAHDHAEGGHVKDAGIKDEAGAVKVDPEVAERLLKTAAAVPGEARRILRLTGEVKLDQTRVVEVPAVASGRIVQLEKFLGQEVKQGDVLAVIHSADFGEAKAAYLDSLTQSEIARKERERQTGVAAALEGLLADLAEWDRQEETPPDVTQAVPKELVGEWKARLLGAAAKLRLAEATHTREKDLVDKGISSRADHETAHQEWEAARAEYAALVEEVLLNLHLDTLRADNALRKSDAALMAAEHKLRILGLDDEALALLPGEKDGAGFARLVIRAPRGGTIIAQDASEGRLVETEQTLGTIADLSNLWVWCDLYERDFAAVHAVLAEGAKLPAVVRVAAFPDRTFPGATDLLDSTVDEHTRTIKARVQVANPDGSLKPGMFAQVEVEIPTEKRTSFVPASAVLCDEARHFVFEKGEDGLWLRRDVVIGEEREGMVEILEGLPGGAIVAASGGFMLKSDVLRDKMGAG